MNKRLSDHLEILYNNLAKIQNEHFSDASYQEGKFTFRYLGGKFCTFKRIKANRKNEVELLFFHDTQIPNHELVQLTDFHVILTDWEQVKISNHLSESHANRLWFHPDEDGLITIGNDEQVLLLFTTQFEAMLVANSFEIFS